MQEDDVPKNLRFNEKDLNFTETKDTPGDSIGKIIKLIESKTVPQESLWFEALMARWAQISAQESTQKAVPQFYQSAEKTGA